MSSQSNDGQLRIFMTADAVGGVWQYALDLTAGLRSHCAEMTLAVLGPTPSDDQFAMAEEAGIRMILPDLPLDWTAASPNEVEETGRVVAHMADQIKPDIIHLNSVALAANASFPAPVVGACHSCVATWWHAVRSGPMPDEFRWRADLVRRGCKRADLLLASTAAFAHATAELYGLESLPVVARNGRRVPSTRDDAPADVHAFTAGRLWDEGKNIATLDRAAARLSIPVRAAGALHGPNGASIDLSHVERLGKLTDADIALHLSGKPIFVSAAYYEPFGLAVLEAAQVGCALVLSDIRTFRELWDGTAIFVQPDDDAAIAGAIEYLARDPDQRRQWGFRAYERAQSYNLENMSAQVLAAYRSVLAERPAKFSLEPVAR